MGVVLITGLVLGLASIYLELKIVKSVPALGWAVKRFGIVGVVFSLFLSVVLGGIFGAAGIVVMIAGICSTATTAPVYKFRATLESKNDEVQRRIAVVRQAKNDAIRTYTPVWKGAKVVGKVVTAPLWLPVKMGNKRQGR